MALALLIPCGAAAFNVPGKIAAAVMLPPQLSQLLQLSQQSQLLQPSRWRQVKMSEVSETRILDEENAKAVLEECMEELGTLFGSNSESLDVGITGRVDFVELDGPILVISLGGRFWHQRTVVVEVRALGPQRTQRRALNLLAATARCARAFAARGPTDPSICLTFSLASVDLVCLSRAARLQVRDGAHP